MSKKPKDVAAENQHPNRIGLKDGVGYALGDAGNLFILTYISSYLKVFFTDILKIKSEKINFHMKVLNLQQKCSRLF